MPSGELTERKWKPFECPYCRVTFEKDWATADFRPYPTFASIYRIRWAACSVCANPIFAPLKTMPAQCSRGSESIVRPGVSYGGTAALK